VSMSSTSWSTGSRNTAIASRRSLGGRNTLRPASRIAPNPTGYRERAKRP
jgi:hypothetical protein